MRHRKKGRKLGRTSAHRQAMLRNMVSSLFQHHRIRTTPEKAKEGTRFAARLITLAKRGSIADRRRASALLGDAKVAVLDKDKDETVQKKIVSILFNDLAKHFKDRPGGYTRIIRLPKHRLGDNASQVIFELILEEKTEDAPAKKKKKKKEKAKKAQPKAEKPKEEKKPVAEKTAEEPPKAEDALPEEPVADEPAADDVPEEKEPEG